MNLAEKHATWQSDSHLVLSSQAQGLVVGCSYERPCGRQSAWGDEELMMLPETFIGCERSVAIGWIVATDRGAYEDREL